MCTAKEKSPRMRIIANAVTFLPWDENYSLHAHVGNTFRLPLYFGPEKLLGKAIEYMATLNLLLLLHIIIIIIIIHLLRHEAASYAFTKKQSTMQTYSL